MVFWVTLSCFAVVGVAGIVAGVVATSYWLYDRLVSFPIEQSRANLGREILANRQAIQELQQRREQE